MSRTYQLIEEIDKAVEGGAYIAALALALTIPDMCCGINSSRKDYVNWYDTYALSGSKYAIRGDECYALRCSFLHQQDGNIDGQNIMNGRKQHIFKVIIPKDKNEIKVSYFIRDIELDEDIINVNADMLIMAIKQGYKKFHEDNPDWIEQHDNLILEEGFKQNG